MIENPVFSVTANGVTAPSFEEILEYFKAKAKDIFGDDINLDEDTQDGQLIALVATALHDVNAQAIATYAAFSPKTAKGAALDAVVAVNGLKRQLSTASQVDLTLIGRAGTVITNGVAIDGLERRWLLPESVTIPLSGEITVTATAEELGALSAAAGTINKVGTPTLGWQSVVNRAEAIEGTAGESDEALRVRQAKSTALPSVSIWDGIVASVRNLEGVTRVSGVKNDTSTVDANGIPAHSIALIVDGGNVKDIGQTIFLKKGEGVGTFGDIETTYIDSYGYPNKISFSRPHIVNVGVHLTITPADTYLSSVADEIKERVATYINSLPIGTSVSLARVLTASMRNGTVIDDRFNVTEASLKKNDGAFTVASVQIGWNEAAACTPDSVVIEVSA